jgi:hypothetical protein
MEKIKNSTEHGLGHGGNYPLRFLITLTKIIFN